MNPSLEERQASLEERKNQWRINEAARFAISVRIVGAARSGEYKMWDAIQELVEGEFPKVDPDFIASCIVTIARSFESGQEMDDE